MKTFWKTRVFSFIALSAMVGGCGVIGREGYLAFTDSFVAPAILGPDNDLIIESKLKLSQLRLEKGRAQSELEACEAAIDADGQAIHRLMDLKEMAANALSFSTTTATTQVFAGNADVKTLHDEKQALDEMLTRQASLVDAAKKNFEGGLITEPEYTMQVQQLDQVRLGLFNNEHTLTATQLMLSQAALAQRALYSHDSKAPTPEQMTRAQLLVQVECQQLLCEADMRTKTVELARLKEELGKVEELEAELLSRPIFKAVEESLDVAFVPYTQIRGVEKDADVMDCVWGVFNCKSVGKVSTLLPGEVSFLDPFGSQSRGQLAVLSVDSRDSMQSKILRIRTSPQIVSHKQLAAK